MSMLAQRVDLQKILIAIYVQARSMRKNNQGRETKLTIPISKNQNVPSRPNSHPLLLLGNGLIKLQALACNQRGKRFGSNLCLLAVGKIDEGLEPPLLLLAIPTVQGVGPDILALRQLSQGSKRRDADVSDSDFS